jgi:hypothetical protein
MRAHRDRGRNECPLSYINQTPCHMDGFLCFAIPPSYRKDVDQQASRDDDFTTITPQRNAAPPQQDEP